MDKVTAGASGSRKENRMCVGNKEPDETLKADEVDVEAGRVTDEVAGREEGEVEAGGDG
jgi:hypothetical protein